MLFFLIAAHKHLEHARIARINGDRAAAARHLDRCASYRRICAYNYAVVDRRGRPVVGGR